MHLEPGLFGSLLLLRASLHLPKHHPGPLAAHNAREMFQPRWSIIDFKNVIRLELRTLELSFNLASRVRWLRGSSRWCQAGRRRWRVERLQPLKRRDSAGGGTGRRRRHRDCRLDRRLLVESRTRRDERGGGGCGELLRTLHCGHLCIHLHGLWCRWCASLRLLRRLGRLRLCRLGRLARFRRVVLALDPGAHLALQSPIALLPVRRDELSLLLIAPRVREEVVFEDAPCPVNIALELEQHQPHQRLVHVTCRLARVVTALAGGRVSVHLLLLTRPLRFVSPHCVEHLFLPGH